MLWIERLKRMSVKKKERHHVLAQSRGGSNDDSNILLITERGHQSLHTLFGFKTLLESAAELRKWYATKGCYEHDFVECDLFRTAYQFVFGSKDFPEAADFLEEIDAKLKTRDSFVVRKGTYSKNKGWKIKRIIIKKNTGRIRT